MSAHQPPRQEQLSGHQRASSRGHKTELVLLVTDMGAICLAPQDLRPHHRVKLHGQNQSIWPACKPLWTCSPSRPVTKGSCMVSSDSLPRCSGPVHSGWPAGGLPLAPLATLAQPQSPLRTSTGSPHPSLSQCQETPPARLASPRKLLPIGPDVVPLVQQRNTSPRASHVPP